ncbi:twin arginine-targeting protein translocase TatB [Gammaproteobacteria bacterium 42_54_T18]|nr:twin arginine-targeting protein translocase TatB [Gammaproteobacteria bacterium 42_54_T18]
MFDIGFFELTLIGIIGLVVLGPERLPHAIRMTSAWIGKLRRASVAVKDELEREVNAHEMKKRIQEQMEEAGLSDIKKTLESAKSLTQGNIINDVVKEQAEKLGLGKTDSTKETPLANDTDTMASNKKTSTPNS